MSNDKEAAPRSVRGRQLGCPVCKHTQFYTREYLLNTRAATFFNFDWANKAALTLFLRAIQPGKRTDVFTPLHAGLQIVQTVVTLLLMVPGTYFMLIHTVQAMFGSTS